MLRLAGRLVPYGRDLSLACGNNGITFQVSGTMQRGKGRLTAIGGFLLIFTKEIWHYPHVMDEDTTERKERWLKLLIANGDDRGLYAAA